MSTNWDFRYILDVYPDKPGFSCVGTTKKGARCQQNWIANSDKARAARLLNEMGTHKMLSSSYKHLEELAELTLCPRWHRDKPGNCQVQSVCMKWRAKIAKYEAEVEMEQEKAAMIKSERALAKLRKTVDDIKVKLEEEEVTNKAPNIGPLATDVKTESRLSASMARLEAKMPMVSARTIPKAPQTILTPPASLDNTPSRTLEESRVDKLYSNNSSHPSSHDYSLPSPPASPLDSKTQNFSEIKLEQSLLPSPIKCSKASSPQRQTFTITRTASVKVTATAESSELTPKTNFWEKTKIETLNLKFPPTPEATPSHSHKKENSIGTGEVRNLAYEFGAGKQVPLPAFDLGVSTKLPDSVPVVDSSSMNSTGDVSAFEFNTQYKIPSKSFEFTTPTKLSYAMRLPEKSSTIWDDFNARAEKGFGKEFRSTEISAPPTLVTTALVSSTPDPFAPKEKLESPTEPPKTPIKTTPIWWNFCPTVPVAPPGPIQENIYDTEESYGYAIVTPTSMRYKTYLPAKQQHGLMTPPETPEERRDIHQDPFLAFTPSPSPAIAILRKPLPNLPTPQTRDGDPGMCEACGIGEDECRCDEDSGMENVRASCLHSLRLRRLQKRVVRKLGAVQGRISRVIRRESDSPTTT